MRQIYIHLHIPKTGGSSFRGTLRKLFGKEGFGDTTSLINDYQYDRQQVGKILRDHFRLRCLSGHKLSLDLPYESEDWNLRVITFIRNPVDHLFSHYYYKAHHDEVRFEDCQGKSLDDYLDFVSANLTGNPSYLQQVEYLTGLPDESGLARVEDCIQNHGLHLFPLDQMNLAARYLAHRYPEDFAGFELHHYNRSQWEPPPTDAQVERARALLQLDGKLYARSQQMLADLTRDLPDTPARNNASAPRRHWASAGLENFGNIFVRLGRSLDKRLAKTAK